jgi:hypothetical protein
MKFHYKGHWKGWALEIKTFLGPEMATSNTNVHKITNVPVFLYGACFDEGKSITRVIGWGVPL